VEAKINLLRIAESKFTPKEQQEIETLQQAMHNPKVSKIEQQIAEAKLSALEASKGTVSNLFHPCSD
jgi:hypothetical protein